MKRIIRQRHLTTEEAERNRRIIEAVEKEIPPAKTQTTTRWGVKFIAQTEDGLKACMAAYYAKPRHRRRGARVVTPGTTWYGPVAR